MTTQDRERHLRDARAVDRLRTRKRRLELRIALRLERIGRTASFVFDGCASLGEFGEKKGFCAGEARILASMGGAVKAAPGLGRDLLWFRAIDDGAVRQRSLLCAGTARHQRTWP